MNKIKAIASLIKKCQCVYDVGSDHALLAIYLLKNKIAKKVVNIDINKNPLRSGLANLRKHNLASKTRNVIADGLIKITKLKMRPDYICIAGLGGHSIIDILKKKDKKLTKCYYVLQANTDSDLLREWLSKKKWRTVSELTCLDRGHYYQIMLVKESDKRTRIKCFETYFGQRSKQVDLETYNKRIKFVKNKIKKHKLYNYSKKYKKLYAAILKNENKTNH